MAQVNPNVQRDFAISVVRRLTEASFEAYFAGGCVRDRLLGRAPKDFDIATSARPEQIRTLFGQRRTLAVGASFGVITVLGPRGAGQIDVATFRQDAVYSDGRHPEHVTFSTAEADAQRRDFTINGMFFDPLTQQVIDFVHGQADLAAQRIKAIGDPIVRFTEDKLRMLRAIRFASVLDFALDPATAQAIRQMADEIVVVSAERIAAEMRRMLVDTHRRRAVELLRETGLLAVVLKEANAQDEAAWQPALSVLELLPEPSFPLALAALLNNRVDAAAAETIARGWRLSGDEVRRAAWLVEHRDAMTNAADQPWPQLQRVLTHPGAAELADLSTARGAVGQFDPKDAAFCRERLNWPAQQLDPPPLVTGDDLTDHGIEPGRTYGQLLRAIRDAQLLGEIQTRADALALVDRLRSDPRAEPPS